MMTQRVALSLNCWFDDIPDIRLAVVVAAREGSVAAERDNKGLPRPGLAVAEERAQRSASSTESSSRGHRHCLHCAAVESSLLAVTACCLERVRVWSEACHNF